jgi:hypothetical protein
MFLCDNCCKKSKISEIDFLFAPKSLGSCEHCGKETVCSDIQRSRMSEPEQQVQPEDEVVKIMKKMGY